ncbi:hypothetical protein J3A83DRAFT_4185141 [Scleroderma citrinum]
MYLSLEPDQIHDRRLKLRHTRLLFIQTANISVGQLEIPAAVLYRYQRLVFMVVGSNAGLGLEASVHIACMKPKLLLVTCRDSDKCKLTRQGNSVKFAIDLGQLSWSGQYHDKGSQQVEACSLDLSKFDGVRAVADHMAVKEDRQLNIIIANAGVLLRDYSSTPDGWDSSLVGLFLQLNTPLVSYL